MDSDKVIALPNMQLSYNKSLVWDFRCSAPQAPQLKRSASHHSENRRKGMKTLLSNLLVAAITIVLYSPALAGVSAEVTIHNYVRAETDLQMRTYVEQFDCFGKFHHVREAYDVTSTATIRPNRDTIYSWGVFDLKKPLTIGLPDPGDRYQSLMIVNQDHSIWAEYGPKDVTLTEKNVGTRYALLLVRTFLDPNNKKDVMKAHALQDAITVKQADKGEFHVADWNKEEVEKMRNAINILAPLATDSSKMFGRKETLDPVYWLLGAAVGWGGLPAKDSTYDGGFPEKNDGKSPYTLTVKGVPVDAFWSVTVYNEKGMFAVNKYNAYSYNSVTAKRNKDGSVTIHFGGNPDQDNYIHIVPGWSYVVRMYRPRKEILDGTWKFPKPVEAK